ncbi:hypothetical protein IGI04_013414 [Brassica rapa subsp. trilocularis]|uniref:Methyltransferase type 11 domain-containing protein n=1 Tax=Brassica rapa subsp. trilocularis TaxID=1813537 RepID=A0ABQ7N8R8_BRACM|nr:hypothetical protein IGI04_013414 [Brassica rapa subsp. trilocularis]
MSKTCNFLGLRVRSNPPLPFSNSSALNLLTAASRPFDRWIRASSRRRLVLGGFAGTFLWMNNMSGNIGGKAFIASARQTNPSPVEQALSKVEWPENFPFKEEDFQRFDESSDSTFYEAPRFVTHIDDPAIAALTKYYSKVLPESETPGVSILDMCSSWVSHYPAGYKQERIVGMGMNEEELKRNPVSVDYLTKPLVVFKEMNRILKPGGLALMSFSNRCFFTKAISIWTSTGDADHALIVGSYFHYAGGYEPPQAVDISPNPGRSDPMYVVFSRKLPVA